AREGHRADRMIEDRNSALEQARARVEVLTPLSIDLPKTSLPRGRGLVVLRDAVMNLAHRRLFGPLSFEFRGPERVAICGSNGSGKTTLLRLIAGQLQPSAGEVH